MGKLIVTVVGCRHLPKADTFSESDPYVKLLIGSKKCQTKVVNNNCNPNFNEAFKFFVADPARDMLMLEVYDKDFFSDDLLGVARVSLRDLPRENKAVQWIPLTHKGHQAGEIAVVLFAEDFGSDAAGSQQQQQQQRQLQQSLASSVSSASFPQPSNASYSARPSHENSNDTFEHAPSQAGYPQSAYPPPPQQHYPPPQQQYPPPQSMPGLYQLPTYGTPPPADNGGYYSGPPVGSYYSPYPPNQQYPPPQQHYPLPQQQYPPPPQGGYPPPQSQYPGPGYPPPTSGGYPPPTQNYPPTQYSFGNEGNNNNGSVGGVIFY